MQLRDRPVRRPLGVAVAALGLLATACSGASAAQVTPDVGDTAPIEPPNDGPIVLGLATQNLERTFFVGLVEGAMDRAEELGVELLVADGRDDVETQSIEIDRLVDSGIDALIVSPIDSEVAPEQLERAITDGVPVVAVANQIGSAETFGPQFVYPGTVSLVTNDDVDMGRKAGLFVAASTDDQVDIAVIAGKTGTANAVLRLDGFVSELDALGVEYEIVANEPGDWNADGGARACERFLAIADIDVIFSMSDAMTAGCVTVLDDADVTIPIVSIGGNEAGIALLREERIVGSICQKPATMGALAVDSAYASITEGRINQGLRFYEAPVVTLDTLEACDPQW